MENARLTALQALLRVDVEQGYSNLVLAQALKKANLEPRDAAFSSTLFYGVLERRMTLDSVIAQYSKIPIRKISPDVLEILRMGIYQLCYLDKIPQSAAVNEAVKLTRSCKKEKAAGFVNGILRSFLRDGCALRLPEGCTPQERLSLEYSCPVWLIRMWQKHYGEQNTQQLLQSLSGRPPLTARLNLLRGPEEQLLENLTKTGIQARVIEGIPGAVELEHTGAIEKNSCFQRGDFHIQDLASQLCCLALAPQPGERVIDVCSAPGGKAFTLAELMQNRGELLAFDLYASKVGLIQEGAKRLGLSIIKAAVRDASKPDSSLPKADRVLCDAPCSGLGIIRRKPEIRYKTPDSLDSLPNLQYLILCSSAQLVREGGTLVYSTCTLNSKENSKVADRFLQEHPEFAPHPIVFPAGIQRNQWEPEHQCTLMPHLHGTDGFFISAFKRLR